MQGSVSIPSDAYFARGNAPSSAGSTAENFGYLNFINDLDTLGKLDIGAARYLKDSTKPAMQSFNHPWLGPMTRLKREKLMSALEAHARGEDLDPRLLRMVAGSADSYKYLGGTAYRPDIVPGLRVINEVRDCHTNAECLMARMLRNTFGFQSGRSQYVGFAGTKAFDAVEDFNKLPEDVQGTLKKLFPSKAGDDWVSPTEIQAVEVYRNFAWPLRSWDSHVPLIARTPNSSARLSRQIHEAQEKYLQSLEKITEDLNAGRMTQEQASLKIQGELSQFGQKSGLSKSFANWQDTHFAGDSNFSAYERVALQESAPLKSSFPPFE
jgi:hypothetical protein